MKPVSMWITLGMSLLLSTGVMAQSPVQSSVRPTVDSGSTTFGVLLQNLVPTIPIPPLAPIQGFHQVPPVHEPFARTNNPQSQSQDILNFGDLFGTARGKNGAVVLTVNDDHTEF